MAFFDFFDNLSTQEALLFGITMFILNAAAVLMAFALVKRKYNRDRDVEKTLYYQSLMFKFLLLPLICISAFIGVFLTMPHLSEFGDYDFFIMFPFIMVFVIFICLIYILAFHKFNKELRGTTVTAKRETKDFFKSLIILLLPFFIALALSNVTNNWVDNLEIDSFILNVVVRLIPYLIIPILSPFTLKILIKAKPMEEGELKEKLDEYLMRNGISNTTLYLWETRERKIANAMVTGITKKRIYVTDYMLDNLSTDEIISILAHEMWHIKKKHVLKRSLLFLPIVLWAIGCAYIFEWIENAYYMDIDFLLGLAMMFVPMLIFGTMGTRFIYRRQEEEADRLVVENGIDAKIYTNALLKLARLNHTVVKFNKVDEQFQTHPSFARRVKRIMNAGGIEDWEE